MKKAVLLLTLFSLMAAAAIAEAPTTVHTYWERLLNVVTGSDEVRDIAVSYDNQYLVTIDKLNTSLKVYEASPGLPHVRIKDMSTSGIAPGNFVLNNGDFSEDGAFFAVSLDAVATHKVYYWPNIDADPIDITTGAAPTNRMGDAMDVQGRVDDNSVEVLISGNNAGTQPIRYTTADNGASWTATTLPNTVQSLDIDLIAGGGWWNVGGGVIQEYDNTGAAIGPSLSGHAAFAVGVDEARGLVFTMGIQDDAVLKVWDQATGALLHTDTEVIDADGAGAGSPGGFFNGSAAVRVINTVSGSSTIYTNSERNGVARQAYGSEITVDNIGAAHPNYASIDSAIKSYASGGGSTTATQPLIISILSEEGPFDEALDLDASIAGNGDFPGDLIMRGVGTTTTVFLQNGSSDDGMVIWQETNEIHIENILFAPSLTNTFLDDVIRLDETNANTDFNWISFKDVIITEVDSLGNPLITSRAEALDPPVAAPGSQRGGSFPSLYQWWGDGGESQYNWMDGVTMFGNDSPQGSGSITQSSFRLNLSNAGEKGYFHNLFVTQTQQGLGMRISSGGGADGAGNSYISISGDDVRSASVDDYSAFTESGSLAFAALWIQDNGGTQIDNSKFETTGPGVGTGGGNYGIDVANAGMGALLTELDDCVFNTNSYGLQLPDSSVSHTYSRNTFLATNGTNAVNIVGAATANKLFVDSIFAGSGATATSAGVDADYCGFAVCGPDALASKGGLGSETNSVDASPVFASTDITSADYLNVKAGQYAGASSTAGDLGGGATFVGGAYPCVDLAITEVMDGQAVTTGFHRYAEITNVGSSAVSLADVAFANANNGNATYSNNGTDLGTQTGVASLNPGESIVLTDNATNFTTIYGFAADANTSAMFVNGDDVLAVVQVGTDNVVDVYGVLGVDGTSQPWEYEDTRVNRLTPASPNLGTFNLTDWDLAATSDLDGAPAPLDDAEHARIGNPGLFDPNMVFVQQIGTGTDLNGATVPGLTAAPSALDLLTSESIQFVVGDLGLNGSGSGGNAVFTDGTDNLTGTDGLLEDANGVGQPTSLAVDFTAEGIDAVAITDINIWSANYLNQDARVFINCHIYLDTSDDDTFNPTFYGEVTTGAKGASNSSNDWTAAYITDASGYLADASVYGVRLDFYSVTDAGTGFRHEGLGGGGSIIKEVDIFGEKLVIPSHVPDWTVFD